MDSALILGMAKSFPMFPSNLVPVAVLLAFFGMTAILSADEGKTVQVGGVQIIFVDGNDPLVSEGETVIARTKACFEELFHRSVKDTKICIRRVDARQMGELVRFEPVGTQAGGRMAYRLQMIRNPAIMTRTGGFHVEGLTFGKNGSYEVKILKNQSGHFGRILAHETTHALVRQIFGEGNNPFLDEGIAEYLAGKSFPAEVQQDLDRNIMNLSRDLLPYVEGLVFCRNHAAETGFAKFFEAQLKHPMKSGAELEESWQRFILK